VTRFRLIGLNDGILAFLSDGTLLVTLFAFNGRMLRECRIDAEPRDCVVMSFNDGITSNYAFLLTGNERVLLMSTHLLRVWQTVQAAGVVSPGL